MGLLDEAKKIEKLNEELGELLSEPPFSRDLLALNDELIKLLEYYSNNDSVSRKQLFAMYTLAGDIMYRMRRREGSTETFEKIMYAKAQDLKNVVTAPPVVEEPEGIPF